MHVQAQAHVKLRLCICAQVHMCFLEHGTNSGVLPDPIFWVSFRANENTTTGMSF